MLKEFKHIILFISLLFILGTIGYYFLEDWDFLDALYMTVITLSTTGYSEVKDLSLVGRIFTMILIIFGISGLFYALGNLNIVLFEKNFFRNRAMQKKMKKITDHYIICGYGRMGHKIALELHTLKKPFVIIEKDSEQLGYLDSKEYIYIEGDAAEDNILIKAGIGNAKGLVAVLSTDVANVFTTLSARGLNPNLKIIARAEEETSREKLIKAGANRVVLPYEIGGFRIAQALLRPVVIDYFDEIFYRSDFNLRIDEVEILPKSSLINKTLAESGIRSELDVIVVAIYRSDKQFIYNPGFNSKLNVNDTLIVIGKNQDLKKLRKIAKSHIA